MGIRGIRGERGLVGDVGEAGFDGQAGPNGMDGKPGPRGPDGIVRFRPANKTKTTLMDGTTSDCPAFCYTCPQAQPA
jgi:hypothetical protein